MLRSAEQIHYKYFLYVRLCIGNLDKQAYECFTRREHIHFPLKSSSSSFEQKSILLLKSQQKYVLLHKLLDILGSLMSGSTRHFFTGTKNMIFVLVFVEKIPIIIANSAPVSVMTHSSSSLLALLSKT